MLDFQIATPATADEEAAYRRRQETILLPETVGELVRDQAALMGDQTAAVWFEQDLSLTYRQIDRISDRLASSLLRLGVRKGCHVAVMLPNCPGFPLTWIALARLGAVMVPINTAYTQEEMQFVLRDSDAQFLVIHGDFADRLDQMPTLPMLSSERVITYGSEAAPLRWEDLAANGEAEFAAPQDIGKLDLLNIQYTSGTTGFPKGCMLSHDYWVIHAHNSARLRRAGSTGIKNVLIWAPFFYMDPMWQFLMTLKLGGTAWIANRMSLSRFMDWLIKYQIDFCIFPEPALSAHPPSVRDREVRLKYVSIYGWSEPSRAAIQSRFNVVAREGYGMTEIGTGTLVPEWAYEKSLVRSCGIPVPFRQLRICSEEGSPTPEGEVGELWVSGRGLMLGYYKRPEANASAFAGSWFRTGDLFRRDQDGFFYLVGRIKEMIKRSGENVAANEVEAVLRAMDEIEEAAVVPVPDPLRNEEIKAFVKLREGVTPDNIPPEAIFSHCAKSLAAFKVPRYLSYIEDDFPRTPSRKIAKNRLTKDIADPLRGSFDRQSQRWL